MEVKTLSFFPSKIAQGPHTDLALHTLGWKVFQDLCAHICEEIFKRPVEIYREAQDGGQDAVFTSKGQTQDPITVQCKFSAKVERRLKPGDIEEETKHILELKEKGQVTSYILITSMSVDAPTAVTIKKRLRDLGVGKPHVYGREYLNRVIRSNARLRALVPRIYGLGDLSAILDERIADQTKALLGGMLPTLKVYVTTRPHIQAIHALMSHGIVLLVGDPATGKSTIAGILATIAAEDPNHRCYKADGPGELIHHWNPHESGGLYWIDDAFGPNQLREDFVDHWIQIIPKIKAAIDGGNRFILTSRLHIYEAAKLKLGSRNHPRFSDNQAIVHVGDLNPTERIQILYNHIKAGTQSQSWKVKVKPYLEDLAKEPNFLPEIARRLADPAYTRQLIINPTQLQNFFRNPRNYLTQTILELSKAHRAALTLVFLHKGMMPVGRINPEMHKLVIGHYNVDSESLGQAIEQLKISFLIEKIEDAKKLLVFKHPTIADAVGEILGRADGTVELYLRGTKPSSILTEVVCDGVAPIRDSILVPTTLDKILIERLTELPDEPDLNQLLFSFLNRRASITIFKIFLEKYPEMLKRKGRHYWSVSTDERILTHAKAHKLNLLSSELQIEMQIHLEYKLFEEADTSFLDDDLILNLFAPRELFRLASRVREELLEKIATNAEDIADYNADLNVEPEDNFQDLSSSMETLEQVFKGDAAMEAAIQDTWTRITDAIEKVREKWEEKHRPPKSDWDWRAEGYDKCYSTEDFFSSPTRKNTGSSSTKASGQPRSIFSDVDE